MTSSGKAIECRNCGNAAGPRACPHCGHKTETRQGPLVETGR